MRVIERVVSGASQKPGGDFLVGFNEINRPIHLARRDACLERAVEWLSRPVQQLGTAERIARVGAVIRMLRQALRHARLAVRSVRATERERDFLHFLELTLQQVESVDALIRHQSHLESKEHGFLGKFLGVSPDEVSLSAINFQRRAEDMLEGLWQVLRMSSAPYRQLQRENLDALSPEERERYERACANVCRTSAPSGENPASAAPDAVARNAASPLGAAEFPA